MHMKIHEAEVSLEKFHVIKRHCLDGVMDVDEYELSYSELAGYPSAKRGEIKFICNQVAHTLARRGSERYSFEQYHRDVIKAMVKVQRGDYSDFEEILFQSDAFPDERVRKIVSWPKSRMINRLLRYTSHHTNTTLI